MMNTGLMQLDLMTFCVSRAQNSGYCSGIAKKLRKDEYPQYQNVKAFYLGPFDSDTGIIKTMERLGRRIQK